MLHNTLENVKQQKPLIHNITNYVTVNDCANVLLACGASPIMADDLNEAAEITSISDALVINIGTLNSRTVESMMAAGKRANERGIPVILDPVGAGASVYRTDTALRLLKEIKFAVVRGNISEIKTLNCGFGNTRGVDAGEEDAIASENIEGVIAIARELSEKLGAVAAITGRTDIIADENHAYMIRNGHAIMGRITGTGCMLTALVGAFCAANKDGILMAAAAAAGMMGLCGELAYQKMKDMNGGTSSFKMYLIDAVSNISSEELKEGIKYEIRS